MSDRKVPLTHARIPREIAKANADPQAKRQAMGQYAHQMRAAAEDPRAAQQAQLAGRIAARRQDVRDQRISNAREAQQAQLRERIRNARGGVPDTAERNTVRSIGRTRTGNVGRLGQLKPIQASRQDSLKRSTGLGMGRIQGWGKPYPTRGG